MEEFKPQVAEIEQTKQSIISPDKKALGNAYPENITPLQKEFLDKIKNTPESEFIKEMKPVVLMGMLQLHGEATRDGLEIVTDDVESYNLNVINRPDRHHKLINLPSPCFYKFCTGCNYNGKGRLVTMADIDKAIQIAKDDNAYYLDQDNDYRKQHSEDNEVHINITSGGSIFNPMEVPDDVRRYLWQKVAEYGKEQKAKGRSVSYDTETRIDDINEENLKEMLGILEGNIDEIAPGFGVERTDPLGQEILWNKGMPKDWEQTVRMLKDPNITNGANVISTGHVILTVPGETEAEGIEYSSQSIKELIDKGLCDRIILMVTNKRKASVPGFIDSKVPSIFTVAETVKRLRKFGEETGDSDKYIKRLMIRGFISSSSDPEFMHAGCSQCKPVEDILRDFQPTDYNKLMDTMDHTTCECHRTWEQEINTPAEFTRQQRAALTWDYLTQKFWKMDLSQAINSFKEVNLDPSS